MTLRAVAFPDSEYIAVRWLNASPLIDAPARTDLVGWTAGQQRLVIARLGGVPSLPYRIDNPRLDIGAWAETKAAAHDLAQLARSVLHDLPNGDHTDLGAVVAHVRDEVGLQWLPDPDTNTPRYIFVLSLTVRPHP